MVFLLYEDRILKVILFCHDLEEERKIIKLIGRSIDKWINDNNNKQYSVF